MNIVINKVRIRGNAAAVFDLTTTARYWPVWHPATISVAGVTERPYQLGDVIGQVVRIAERSQEKLWTVTECVRPQQVTLQMQDGRTEVRFTFTPLRGRTQVVCRLVYPADLVDNAEDTECAEKFTHAESDLGLPQLKMLIEDLLQRENL